jgi:large subunit ribosomal protein L22
MDLLRFVPKKAAELVRKTLASAIANAENNNNLNPGDLTVHEAVVGEGPTAKRFQPKARGSAGPIRKRSSHIRIVLTDEVEIKRRDKNAKKTPKSKKAPARKPKGEAKAEAKPEAPSEKPASAPQTPAAE